VICVLIQYVGDKEAKIEVVDLVQATRIDDNEIAWM
jgi:hypothetical protein